MLVESDDRRVWRGPGVDPGEPQHGVPRVGIDPAEDDVLRALAAGRDVLEIGTGLGYSTRAMAAVARTVVTIDIDPWVAKKIASGLPPNVVFRKAWPPWWRHEWYDLAFIDGDHRPHAVKADLARAAVVVRPSGLLVFHDWFGTDGIREVVMDACGPGALVMEARTRYGIGVIVLTEAVRDRVMAPEAESW